jgi:hypothetical protein
MQGGYLHHRLSSCREDCRTESVLRNPWRTPNCGTIKVMRWMESKMRVIKTSGVLIAAGCAIAVKPLQPCRLHSDFSRYRLHARRVQRLDCIDIFSRAKDGCTAQCMVGSSDVEPASVQF